jgi:hypothetical protein
VNAARARRLRDVLGGRTLNASFKFWEESMGPLEVMLFAGLTLPAGWADGLTHSPASKVECAKLIEKLPAYARASAKCIVKIDSNAKKLGS